MKVFFAMFLALRLCSSVWAQEEKPSVAPEILAKDLREESVAAARSLMNRVARALVVAVVGELASLSVEENLLLRSTQETDAELAKLRQDRQAAAERELARREQIESLAREKERRLAVEEQLEASVRALEQEKEEREMLELNKQKMLKRLASDNKMQLQRQRRQQAEVQQLEQQCQEQEASERSKRVLVQQVREDCVCVWYCRSWNPIRLPL